MNARLKLAAIFIPLGLIMAAIPDSKTLPKQLSAEELLTEVQAGTHYISTDEIADMIIQKDPSLQLVDVRTPEEFEEFHLPGAVNVPMGNLFSDEYIGLFDQDLKTNVIYSNGNTMSTEAWMVLRQKGFEYQLVMKGGLNHWAKTIMNPEAPASTSPDDEIALYQFRKGAGMALGGASLVQVSNEKSTASPKPVVKRKKKKRAAGGC